MERVREMLGTTSEVVGEMPTPAADVAETDAGGADAVMQGAAVAAEKPAGADAEEPAAVAVPTVSDDALDLLREIFRSIGGIVTPETLPEEMERAVLGEKDPNQFLVGDGRVGLVAQTRMVLTQAQADAMREVVARYKRGQKGAKAWCHVLTTIRYKKTWYGVVRAGQVLWEFSGFAETALEAMCAAFQRNLALDVCLAPPGVTVAAEPEAVDAIWKAIDTDEAPQQAAACHMKIDDVLHILGQGVVVSGVLENGPVRVGDAVTIIGKKTGKQRDAVVRALQRLNETDQMVAADNAAPGDGVCLLLPGVGKKEVAVGDTLVGR